MDPSTQEDPLADFIPKLPPADTSRPCPIKGDYLYRLTKVEPHLGKVHPDSDEKDPNKRMLKLTWTSCQESQPVVGTKLIPVGYELTEYALLYQPEPKPGKQPFDFTAAIARRYDALFGTNNETRPENYADLRSGIGRVVMLNLEPIEDAFGWKAEIKKHKVAPPGAA